MSDIESESENFKSKRSSGSSNLYPKRYLAIFVLISLVGFGTLMRLSKTPYSKFNYSFKPEKLESNLFNSVADFLFGATSPPVIEDFHSANSKYLQNKSDLLKEKSIAEENYLQEIKLPPKESVEDPKLSKSLPKLEASIEDEVISDPKSKSPAKEQVTSSISKPLPVVKANSKSQFVSPLKSKKKVLKSSVPGYYSPSKFVDDLVVPNGTDVPPAPIYMPYRKLNGLGKKILFWDMSHDSKVADYADGHFIVAALENDTLYYSSDSGESFTNYGNSSGVHNWLGVAINYEGEKLIAIGYDSDPKQASVYRSSDFGISWRRSNKAGSDEYALLSTDMQGSKVYIAVNGPSPSIKYSYNQGETWASFTKFAVNPVEWVALTTDYSGTYVYAASLQSSDGGFIYRSRDKAKTFTILQSLGMKQWSGIYPQNWGTRTIFTTKNDLNYWFTKDAGESVVARGNLPFTNASLCVSFEQAGGGFIYAVKPGEPVYKSFDMGNTFHKDSTSGSLDFNKCMMTSYGTFSLVSSDSEGFFMSDKATSLPMTMEQIGVPFRPFIPEVRDPNILSAIAMSENGEYIVAAYGNAIKGGNGIFISSDQGNKWATTNLHLDQFEELSLRITNNGSVIAVIGWGRYSERNLFMTYDGGETWVEPSEELQNDAQYVTSSSDLNHIFVTTFRMEPTIAVSHDQGQTFTLIELKYTNFYMFTSISSSLDGSRVYASTFDTHGNGFIYRSDSYGDVWEEIPTQPQGAYMGTITAQPYLSTADWNEVVNSGDGLFVMAVKYMSNLIYISHDGGLTWVRNAASPVVFNSVCMSSDGSKIIGTEDFIFTSLDGGLSWGRDEVSGKLGWNECEMSSDGKKNAIKRFLIDSGEEDTAVYLNVPFNPTSEPTNEPTKEPVATPTKFPTYEPTAKPSKEPTFEPTGNPVFAPTFEPTKNPIAPTYEPTIKPTAEPTVSPSPAPSLEPTVRPSADPTLEPTRKPSALPTLEPTHLPTLEPTVKPSATPTLEPSPEPSGEPVAEPTTAPIDIPTMEPTPEPSMTPTHEPTVRPSAAPSAIPTETPTPEPTNTLKPISDPTIVPISEPTMEPTHKPSAVPTFEPTKHPVTEPTAVPFLEGAPTMEPTKRPIMDPTLEPTKHPHTDPTFEPTLQPNPSPSAVPTTATPTMEPTVEATPNPTTLSPTTTADPTEKPTEQPSQHPKADPTLEPTRHPVSEPTKEPFIPGEPTYEPTKHPSHIPTLEPTKKAERPTNEPTLEPSPKPGAPTAEPTIEPTKAPQAVVEEKPTNEPTLEPSPKPGAPTAEPTIEPTKAPFEESSPLGPEPENPPAPLPIVCANDNGTSTYCPGLLPSTVAKIHLLPGCVLLSVNDLATVKVNPKYEESSILVICSSQESGVVKVDEKILTEFDMIFEDTSLISSVIFGPDTQLKVYSGGNFDGDQVTLVKPAKSSVYSLSGKTFPKLKQNVNDKIKSFEFVSTSKELNKCESAMQVYYFSDYMKKLSKKRLRVRS